MSMYGVFMNERFAVIAADTKKTTVKDGKVILQQLDYQKLYLFNNLAVAFGGSTMIIQLILENLSRYAKEEITIHTINDIVQNSIKPNKNALAEITGKDTSEYMLEILAIHYNSDIQKNVMYHISSVDDFKFEETIFHGKTSKSNSYSWGGYEPETYSKSFAEYCRQNKPNDLVQTLLHNFQINVNERVGGFMDIIGFDRGELVVYNRFQLQDADFKKEIVSNAPNTSHAVFTGHVVGGSIESDTDINVHTDACIGRYLRVGYISHSFDDEGKIKYQYYPDSGILLGPYTSIRTGNDNYDLVISAFTGIQLNADMVTSRGKRILTEADLDDLQKQINELKGLKE